MKPTKPVIADENNYIYTEGIDYSKTSTSSIWGDEDKSTQALIKRLVKNDSNWVNLAAGDGRYNTLLVGLAKSVTAVDIDEGALEKLLWVTPDEYKPRIVMKVFNLVETFPLDSNSYDGVFSTGALYIFPKNVFTIMANEIARILKVGGHIAFEWAIDIKRVTPSGELLVFGDEPMYNKQSAIEVLQKAFPNFELTFTDGEEVYSDESEANPPYEFHCKTLLVEGKKLS